MKSIYLRNFVATAVMVSICFLIVAFSFVGIGRNYLISEYRDDMVNSAREVARTASAVAQTDSLSSWVLGMSISAVANSTGNQIFITDAEGTVVTCSDKAPICDHMGTRVPDEVMGPLRETGSFDQLSTLGGMYKSNRMVVATAITAYGDGELLGYVFVSNVIDNMLGAWSTFLMIASVVTIGVFCAALLVSLVYSKRMARPLDDMAAASRKFARGDFSVRVRQEDDPTDEMGALIDSFNKMADSLEQAEKRRSEFIANISHELRTPMTTIAGFADGILDGTIPREDQEKYLRSIRDETRRLSRLVRDMLSVSQAKAAAADPGKRVAFDLTELVLQTLLSFEGRATKKNLDVDPQFPENHLMVKADKDAITQVIYNLLDNAVKFATPGSCLILRLYKDNGKAYVSVKDFGETIPPDDLPFIFDRFHKSDRSRSMDKDGVGLGLYLVKTIINSHDEDIAVRSEDGMTEFVFTLPLAE
ncbi:MAG: HAMP domain-containing sensor histidine kinase [Oscillospiraceae bacterium]|nr:HAMP domain-containing sensor histidine kinase [Oscillospiraceae bacterium]